MRKLFGTILFIMLLILLSACFDGKPEEEHGVIQELNHAAQSEIAPAECNAPKNNSENITSIDFRYIYRGFSPVPLDSGNQMEDYMRFGTKVIINENDWNTFMASYCPGIPYYDTWDFSQECLIASIASGARPSYVNSSTITKLSWENGYFVFEYENDPDQYLYVLNSNDVTHFYVEVIAINRENLPEGAEIWAYHP